MSLWLIFAGLMSAHAGRPKLFAVLNDRFSIHETRARVGEPAAGELARLTAEWPLDPARSRDLEDALEREFDRRLLTSTNNHVRTAFMPYVVARIAVDHADIDRYWRPPNGKARRLIRARVSFAHTRTGTETEAIPFTFVLKRKGANDPDVRLRLIEIGPYVAKKTPAENREVLDHVLNEAWRVCAAELE